MKRPSWLKTDRTLFALLFSLGLLCFASPARAINCASAFSTVSNWYLDFGTVTDNPSLPVGTVLATGRVLTPGPYRVTLNCTGTGAAAVVSIRPTRSTDVPVGTGLAVRLLYNGSAVRSDTAYQTYSSVGTYSIEPTGVGVTAQLIKTAAVTNWGSRICSAPVGLGSLVGASGVLPYIYGCAQSFTQATPTCTVNTGSVTIPLGNVAGGSFGSVGSVSTTSAAQNIALTCAYAPRVRMTLQGTQAAGGPNTTVALTGAGGAGVAQGIGVQILYGGNPLVVNSATPTVVSTAAGATLNVPVAARYYRTAAVTAGRANASPTLRFDYN